MCCASLFLKLFGDPAHNPKGWDVVRFEQVLNRGLRNGISPSSKGDVKGKVLILSAITGPDFAPSEVKEGRFDSRFSPDQLVNQAEFLICRGNGNRNLVGVGRFPNSSLDDTVFPDTMIAANIDQTMIEQSYLEDVWSTRHVRSQIERGARTTNGTYKVNQGLLSSIQFPLPPREIQLQYTAALASVRRLHEWYCLPIGDDLFNSIQQRAFRGEL